MSLFTAFLDWPWERKSNESRWGSASCLSTPKARAPVDLQQLWLCWRGLCRGPDFHVWVCLALMGIQWNAKWEKFHHPPTKPVLELAMCVWGGKGDFKSLNHIVKGIRSHWVDKAKQGQVLFLFILLQFHQSLKFMRSEALGCLWSLDRPQSVTLLPNTISRAAEVFHVPQQFALNAPKALTENHGLQSCLGLLTSSIFPGRGRWLLTLGCLCCCSRL